MLGTIKHADTLLSCFTLAAPEWGVSELARMFEAPKSTIHEQLASLAAIGYLSRTPSGRYRLGPRLYSFPPELNPSETFMPMAPRYVITPAPAFHQKMIAAAAAMGLPLDHWIDLQLSLGVHTHAETVVEKLPPGPVKIIIEEGEGERD